MKKALAILVLALSPDPTPLFGCSGFPNLVRLLLPQRGLYQGHRGWTQLGKESRPDTGILLHLSANSQSFARCP